MDRYRKNAVLAGVLYIIGTVTGVLSVVVAGDTLDRSDYLVQVSANDTSTMIGSLLTLAMGLALAMVPVVLFPVLKKHGEVLALGYVVFRGALETFTYLALVLSMLLLVTLSRTYVQAGATEAPAFQALGTLLLEAEAWIVQITTIVFILGAMMFYYTLYRAKLVPRWISGWGLVSAAPYFIASFLVIFGVIEHFSMVDALMRIPLGLQEMVLAVWLIVKGFD